MPPVFIVVCNNTSTSMLVYDFISCFKRKNEDETETYVGGRFELFRNNVAADWRWGSDPAATSRVQGVRSGQRRAHGAADPASSRAARRLGGAAATRR